LATFERDGWRVAALLPKRPPISPGEIGEIGLDMEKIHLFAGQNGVASLTIHNAASSQQTLWIMAIIAFIGMPLVASYTVLVYWTFRGKAQADGY
jgi:hypothetical protein